MKKLSGYLNYLILLMITVYSLIYFFDISPVKLKKHISKSSADVDQLVNKFLKQTSSQALKDELAFKAALQNQLNKSLQIQKQQVPSQRENNLSDQQVVKEDMSSYSPAETIQTQLYQQDLVKKQDEENKKEYVRQLVENARADGFHVVVSAEYKVLSVTPIRKPSQNDEATDLFPAD